MGPMVVYVHGNGNKVREELLRQRWDSALFGQDLGSSSRMAYWAPVRYATPLPDPGFDEIEQLPESPLEATAPPVVDPPEAFIDQTTLEARGETGRRRRPRPPRRPQGRPRTSGSRPGFGP